MEWWGKGFCPSIKGVDIDIYIDIDVCSYMFPIFPIELAILVATPHVQVTDLIWDIAMSEGPSSLSGCPKREAADRIVSLEIDLNR